MSNTFDAKLNAVVKRPLTLDDLTEHAQRWSEVMPLDNWEEEVIIFTRLNQMAQLTIPPRRPPQTRMSRRRGLGRRAVVALIDGFAGCVDALAEERKRFGAMISSAS
jgi:hypothetical protein